MPGNIKKRNAGKLSALHIIVIKIAGNRRKRLVADRNIPAGKTLCNAGQKLLLNNRRHLQVSLGTLHLVLKVVFCPRKFHRLQSDFLFKLFVQILVAPVNARVSYAEHVKEHNDSTLPAENSKMRQRVCLADYPQKNVCHACKKC